MPERTSIFSNSGTSWKNCSTCSSVAKTHDLLDAGAVVPGAVEQHDLAARRQVRHVALEIPLRPLAVAGLLQRHHPAHARVEPLGDALDHAALAGRVAPFEDHRDLGSGVLDPVLQLDQLGLQPQQLAEIDYAVECFRMLAAIDAAQLQRQRRLGHLEFEVFVQRVLQLGFEPVGAVVFFGAGVANSSGSVSSFMRSKPAGGP
jgi:hypothetical protein